jgi:MFS family permease
LIAGGVLAALDWRAVFWVNVPVGVFGTVWALQGIWLPLQGYNYSDTPLWAGIFLLPLTAAFLISGPLSGFLSDRFGGRGFATAGMLVFGASFIGLMLLPVNFRTGPLLCSSPPTGSASACPARPTRRRS